MKISVCLERDDDDDAADADAVGMKMRVYSPD
jgi:hypothetical protein